MVKRLNLVTRLDACEDHPLFRLIAELEDCGDEVVEILVDRRHIPLEGLRAIAIALGYSVVEAREEGYVLKAVLKRQKSS